MKLKQLLREEISEKDLNRLYYRVAFLEDGSFVAYSPVGPTLVQEHEVARLFAEAAANAREMISIFKKYGHDVQIGNRRWLGAAIVPYGEDYEFVLCIELRAKNAAELKKEFELGELT